MADADKTLVVRFGEDSADRSEISVELDDLANEGNSDFAPGDTAFLRVHRWPQDIYAGFTNANSLSKVATGVVYQVTEETIVWTNEQEKTLDFRPSGGVDYSWVGADPGINISFSGKKIIASNIIKAAVMLATYKTVGDRWSVSANFEGRAVIVMIMGDVDSATQISFGGDAIEPVDYNLEVVDYCTGDILVGATVWFDGVDIGQTNNLGIIFLGLLQPGSQHTLKIIKAGYLDSDVDNIKNDSFTVPGGS